MNKTKVELPDGRLLVIEGGDAKSTAKFLVNHYLGQGPVVSASAEEVLGIPEMRFETATRSAIDSAPARNVPVLNLDEEPLALPAMRF